MTAELRMRRDTMSPHLELENSNPAEQVLMFGLSHDELRIIRDGFVERKPGPSKTARRGLLYFVAAGNRPSGKLF